MLLKICSIESVSINFMWRALQGILPSNVNMIDRYLNISLCCKMCGLVEDGLHVCSISIECWQIVDMHISSRFISNMSDLFQFILGLSYTSLQDRVYDSLELMEQHERLFMEWKVSCFSKDCSFCREAIVGLGRYSVTIRYNEFYS